MKFDEIKSQEDLEKLLQSETDKRVTEALKTAEKTWSKKLDEELRKSKLTEEEKYKEELAERENRIAEKEKQIALMENKATATKLLTEKGISVELVDLVVADDADTMKVKIEALEKTFSTNVKTEVEKRLAGGAPRNSGGTDTGITKEQFSLMSIGERQQLYQSNQELYKQLSQ